MAVFVRLFWCALAVILSAGLGGCLPSGHSQAEEEKESHFLLGKSRVNSMDYGGAVEAFGKALEVNPHSASAHFELGWLYDEKQADPAAAIYHYERFIKLRPRYENPERIRQRIYACKQDLAKTVSPLPVGPGVQRELEQLAQENKRLQEENNQLRMHLAAGALLATNPPALLPGAHARAAQTHPGQPGQAAPGTGRVERLPAGAGTMRAHVVKAGDSLFSIARKYGVKLEALQAANPNVEPRRLQPGQTLKIPAQ